MTEKQRAETRNSGSAGDTARETAGQAKEAVRETLGQAKEAVRESADQAREQVNTRLSDQKARAAQSLSGMAHALRMTGQQLREQDQSGITGYVDQLASSVEQFSSYVEQHELGDLVGDVERFARRQPALFLGGAFVLGLLGARFLKSSASQRYQQGDYPLARRPDQFGPYGSMGQQGFRGTTGTYGSPYSAGFGSGVRRGTTGTYDSPYRSEPGSDIAGGTAGSDRPYRAEPGSDLEKL